MVSAAIDNTFGNRLARHHDELDQLFMSLYDDRAALEDLEQAMAAAYEARPDDLKKLDKQREADPDWYKRGTMFGMTMYTDLFAGSLRKLANRIPYLEEQNLTYLHLMPLLKMPHPHNDGGYAVEDFNTVDPTLGTNHDLANLTKKLRKAGISLCLDFVMNHTASTHEWAMKAKAGDPEYQDYYYCYDDRTIPDQYDAIVPQVFPNTAPGNFTWCEEMHKWVLTSFYPFQWDLNYRNPKVLVAMLSSALNLANLGVEVLRIDAVPYIWKELGTNCRNLPQVHTIVRMMRLIGEIVCPGIVLLGEVVMEPDKLAPYFGPVEKPECHMLYNATTMCTTWSTVATRDARLLRRQTDIVSGLPKEYTFLNYLRCHDDIGWGLDYATLRQWGMREVPHKRYLSDYFCGLTPGSVSRGELYNADPVSGDARFCGTTASMCGIEAAGFEGDDEAMANAIRKDVTLHAFVLTQSGIPMLYSGDEVGQVNDYSYHDDPEKAEDSRYVHRGRFDWSLAEKIDEPGSVQQRLFSALSQIEKTRASEPVFDADATVWTKDYDDPSVLWVIRRKGGRELHAVFNFSDEGKTLWMPWKTTCTDLLTGEKDDVASFELPGWGFAWLLV